MKEFENALDDRAEGFLKSGDLASSIAEHAFKVDVDDITRNRWRQLMGLMREVDTWADDTETPREEVLLGLADFTLFENRYPDLRPNELGTEAHEKVLRRAERILKIGDFIAQTSSPDRFTKLRISEAHHTVNLFTDVATEHVRGQDQFEKKFIPNLRELGAAATLWDSLIDGKMDWRNGSQIIKPSPKYYEAITRAMLQRAKTDAPVLIRPEPLTHLAIKSVMRVKNRFKNGIPEYSTLRMFDRDK